MKFKNYIENVNKFAEEHPEALEYDVVYSEDDEGNSFSPVNYEPVIGHFNQSEYMFVIKSDIKEDEEEEYTLNAVCIN